MRRAASSTSSGDTRAAGMALEAYGALAGGRRALRDEVRRDCERARSTRGGAMDLNKMDPDVRGWVEQILDQGYAIREQALPADVCDTIVETFEGMAGSWDRVLVQDFHGRRTVRYFDLLNGPDIFA